MDTPPSEFEELKARVVRLESELAELRKRELQPIEPWMPVVVASSPVEPPGLTPPPLPNVAGSPARQTREIPSAVWIAGAGAVIFLIGAVYGLTVSIQRGWISPPMRVGAGLGLGLVLAVAAWFQLRREQRGLGVALLATGVGTWTFSLYFGAHGAHLFSPISGLVGASLATLLAGWIAARLRSDGAMAVAIATGLVAPVAFSSSRGNVPALLTYLLALNASHLLVLYLTQTGARWVWSRSLGSAGLWLVVALGVAGAGLESPGLVFVLLAGLGVGGLLLAWMPFHREFAAWPGALTVVTQISLAVVAWMVWDRSNFVSAEFSFVLAALAVVSVGLVPLGRKRDPAGRHDAALFFLGLGLTLIALAVALDWRSVVISWGVVAVLLAWAAKIAGVKNRSDAGPLQFVAVWAALAASMVWLALVFGQRPSDMIFFNRVFVGGSLAATAWWLLFISPGAWCALACVLTQLVAVNALAWELARAVPGFRSENASLMVGPLLATLVYALAGVGLWLSGLSRPEVSRQKLFRLSGYGWVAVASVKLLVSDLARTDLLFRAVAALGVGTILIMAAWWASRRREE